jgi:hypothetical protein
MAIFIQAYLNYGACDPIKSMMPADYAAAAILGAKRLRKVSCSGRRRTFVRSMVVDSQVPPNLMLPVLVGNVWAYGGARDFTCWQTPLLSLKPEVNTRLGTVLGHPLLPVAL